MTWRDKFPCLCLGMCLDWDNPLLYLFVGVLLTVFLMIVLAVA